MRITKKEICGTDIAKQKQKQLCPLSLPFTDRIQPEYWGCLARVAEGMLLKATGTPFIMFGFLTPSMFFFFLSFTFFLQT